MNPLTIGLEMAAGAVLLALFITFERCDLAERNLAVVLGALVVEVLVYPDQTFVPDGIFRVPVGSESFRLTELLVGLALAARVLTTRPRRRPSPAGLAWAVFFTWYATAAAVGILNGNPTSEALYQAKGIIYIGGTMALAAGIRPERLVSRRALGGWVVTLGGAVAVLLPLTMADASLGLTLPGIPAPDLGQISADSASMFMVVGVIVLLVEGARVQRRPHVALAGLVLLLAVFAPAQRAAVVGLVATLALLMVVACGRRWRRRILATPTEVGLAVGGLLAIGLTFSLARVQEGDPLPLVGDVYEDTFGGVGNVQSADSRLFLWARGAEFWRERPLLGHGLGKVFSLPRPDKGDNFVSGGFHSIPYDLLVRTGVVGLVLFAVAMALTARQGWLAWRHHVDARVAMLALACLACVVGLLTKGSVESIFEKVKLATVLGFLLGTMVAAAASDDEPARQQEDVMSWS